MAEYKDFVDERKTVKEGMMYKRGAINTDWKLRHFVLNGRQLTYFKGGRSAPSGSVDMKSVIGVTEVESDTSFKVQTQKRTYDMRGETPAKSREWRDALYRIYKQSFRSAKS